MFSAPLSDQIGRIDVISEPQPVVRLEASPSSTVSYPAQPHPPLRGSGGLNTPLSEANGFSLSLTFEVLISICALSFWSYSDRFFCSSRNAFFLAYSAKYICFYSWRTSHFFLSSGVMNLTLIGSRAASVSLCPFSSNLK